MDDDAHKPAKGAKVASLDVAKKRKAKRDKSARRDRAQGNTLCRRGFHRWAIDQSKQFDVRSGRLVTVHRCLRCGEHKTTLD